MEFRLRVKRLRKELDLTQQELADKVGIGQSTIGQIESGRNKSIKADKLLKLAQALNTTTEYLINGEQANNSSIHEPNNLGTQNNVIGTQNNLPENAGNLKTMLMPDNSFAPLIPQGSELTYNTSDTGIRNGKIYLIQQGDQVFIRRAFPQLSGNLKWVCDNAVYGADELPSNAVKIVGRVVAWTVND